MGSVIILQYVEVLRFSKVLISLVRTQFKPIQTQFKALQTLQLHLGALTRACSLRSLSQLGPDGPNCNILVNSLYVTAKMIFLIQYFFYRFLSKNSFKRIKNKLLVSCWTLNAMENLSLGAIIRAQNILLFSALLSKHLKNTCEKGYFLAKLQGGGSIRYALIFLNLSAKNLAKQFSCRKYKYF